MSEYEIIKPIELIKPTGKIVDNKKEVSLYTIEPKILGSPTTLGNSVKYNGKSLIAHINASLSSNFSPKVWYESDTTRNPFSSNIYSICYGNGKFVAVGGNGKMAYSSDGVTWTEVANSAFGSYAIQFICYGDGKYIASGYNGRMAYYII